MFVAPFEDEQSLLHLSKIGEVIGREGLALDRQEADFHLLKTVRVDRHVDEDESWPPFALAIGGFVALVAGVAVHYLRSGPGH